MKNGKVKSCTDDVQDYAYPQHHHCGTTEDNGALYQEINTQTTKIEVSPAVPPRKDTAFYSVIGEDLIPSNYSLLEPEYHILENERTMCFDSDYYACPNMEKYMVGT